jgi:hypothetical protein
MQLFYNYNPTKFALTSNIHKMQQHIKLLLETKKNYNVYIYTMVNAKQD